MSRQKFGGFLHWLVLILLLDLTSGSLQDPYYYDALLGASSQSEATDEPTTLQSSVSTVATTSTEPSTTSSTSTVPSTTLSTPTETSPTETEITTELPTTEVTTTATEPPTTEATTPTPYYPIPDSGIEIINEVTAGQLKTYSLKMFENGLLLHLSTFSGNVTGYYSFTNPFPDAMHNDGQLQTEMVWIKNANLKSSEKQVHDQVYIGIKGIEERNEFSLRIHPADHAPPTPIFNSSFGKVAVNSIYLILTLVVVWMNMYQ